MCSAISGMTGYFVQANKIGRINLAATGKDLMEDEKQVDVTVDLFTSLDMESEAVAEHSAELENNQTLGLLCGFLSVDDWYINSSYFIFNFLVVLLFCNYWCEYPSSSVWGL